MSAMKMHKQITYPRDPTLPLRMHQSRHKLHRPVSDVGDGPRSDVDRLASMHLTHPLVLRKP